ncbi:MAG: hypothetical protein KatS3mg112_0507 [Thermogutta sp.]|nr:MAG: hypothetical protein KatS3mg112_0507 [Thermogutta sp.]
MWIADLSVLWQPDFDQYAFVSAFLERLDERRGLTSEERKRIPQAIQRAGQPHQLSHDRPGNFRPRHGGAGFRNLRAHQQPGPLSVGSACNFITSVVKPLRIIVRSENSDPLKLLEGYQGPLRIRPAPFTLRKSQFLPLANGEEIQAEVVRHLYRLWFSVPAMASITWWNLADGTAVEGGKRSPGCLDDQGA